MNTYAVSIITDLDEQVYTTVQAYDEAEAESIAVTMLENGELESVGMICASIEANQI